MDGKFSWEAFFKGAATFFVCALVIGVIILGLTGILGKWSNAISNDLFNTSQQHTGAVAQKFSDDCLQLSQAKSEQERLAIENDIYQVASTVDLTSITMSDTTRTCVNTAVRDVTNGK